MEEMDEEEDPPEVISMRACWELAALSHFYRAVGPALRLSKLSATDIERRLLCPAQTQELLIPLLNLQKTPAAEASAACWRAILELRDEEELLLPFPLGDSTLGDSGDSIPLASLATLDVQQRLQLLLGVAEARLCRDSDELAALHGGDVHVSSLRPEMMGNDSEGRIYWFLGDGRLYRESVGQGPARARRDKPPKDFAWEVAASNGGEWRGVMEKLKKRGAEAALREELSEKVEAIEAKEAKTEREKKRVALMEGPRRLSSRYWLGTGRRGLKGGICWGLGVSVYSQGCV